MDIELDFKRIPSLADELSQLEIGSSCVSLVSEHRHRQFFKPHLHYRGKIIIILFSSNNITNK
jgi:hypothetical protein